MKYAVEIGSDAMIYTSIFTKTGSGILKLLGGYTNTNSVVISYAYFHFSKISKIC
jgi:hypothetical protein